MGDSSMHDSVNNIAVIGMTGRYPKSKNLDEFWQNLRNGVELITFMSDEELEAEGVAPSHYNNPNYVKSAGGVLDDIELFDASFFDYTPREADSMDPQHRIFLECAWEVLENAGYDPEKYPGAIGVYASLSMNSYLLHNLYSNREFLESLGGFNIMVANDKDFLTTRASYKFNLTGPSMVVQTACSASLVALCQAVQSLLSYQCDMALAGGISIGVPKTGYVYQQGGIASPDGHCRTFDAKAAGTFGGNGVGIVILKRLADALADGDHIHAVVKGAAMNNDGSLKVGYTAPSVDGQAEVITMAQALAGITADTIGYIEAHGTGTELGDPIEIAALTKAFRATTNKKGYCGIGSVKTNMGHLDAAAGISGFIKAVLTLENKEIPPSLNFEKPNPKIDFGNSPFYVNHKLSEFKKGDHPRRAGVSAFGIGGTNAHVVLEEAPERERSGDSRAAQLLVLSAKTSTALDSMTANLASHFKNNPDCNLADAAYTLQQGRKAFKYRRIVVCQDFQDAKNVLESGDRKRVVTATREPGNKGVAFMFPGQGAQHVNMGKELYETEPKFREVVDKCCEVLKPHLNLDLRDILYPKDADTESATKKLTQTAITQPALFVIEYALAQLWISWGIRPQAMIGHSIGEYVAACLAGVFSLADALVLVAERGRLMQSMPAGSMVAVSRPAVEVVPLLKEKLSLAAVNAPGLCVVSGPTEEIDKFEKELKEKKIDVRRLHTSHAFHSEMMDPILEPFTKQVANFKPAAPKIPFISNVTGTWITSEQATDPSYWAQHLRQAVKFAAGAQELLKEPSRVLLEAGPGRTLNSLAGMTQLELRKEHKDLDFNQLIVSSMRHPEDAQSDLQFLLSTVGRLWLAGVELNWSKFYENEKRHRIPLPTYPFERERYWIEPKMNGTDQAANEPVVLGKKEDIADWFYVPVWKQSFPSPMIEREIPDDEKACWLVFADAAGLGEEIMHGLVKEKQNVVTVLAGENFEKVDAQRFLINPRSPEDYDALIRDLCSQEKTPEKIVHMWGVTSPGDLTAGNGKIKSAQVFAFFSLLYLAQALGKANVTHSIQLTVITNNMQEVTGDEVLFPEKATVLGACKVIPQEYLNIICQSLDIVLPESDDWQRLRLVKQLTQEITSKQSDLVVAYRGNQRWVQTFDAMPVGETEGQPAHLRKGGVYLITGGLGRIGLVLAKYLAQTVQAKLILTSRNGLPPKDEWEKWLANHDENDTTSQKIRKVLDLEKLGAEVLPVKADSANLDEMKAAVDMAKKKFATIHGVIHAAGVLVGGKFNSIADTNKADCEAQFRPKIDGLIVLKKILKGQKLDFCLLFSSISSVLGGLGFLAYSAANLFMDAFARVQNRKNGVPWVSVNWDAWQFGEVKQSNNAARADLADLALMPDEGVEVFGRVLSFDPLSQIIVSTGDLQARINKWVKLESIRKNEGTEKVESQPRHSRPTLQEDYVAPTNDLEQTLADIWQELFGIDKIGIQDNFFELGGHSLLATSVGSRVRDAFQVELSLQSFFEKPTIAELANVILEKMVEAEDSDTLHQILEEIEAQS